MILIFISKIVEIFPDLCYSIEEVAKNEGFRLIILKSTIPELAALKESIFKGQTPKGGTLIFFTLMIDLTGLAIPHKRLICRLF